MELFTGDRREFPRHVAPFPESADLTAVIRSPENPLLADHRPHLPPQKLRPIRYNGRSPSSSLAEDPPEFTEVVELLRHQACPADGVSGDYLHTLVKAKGAGVAHTDSEPRSGAVSEGRLLESSSSSSSDSDDNDNDSPASIKEPANGKRKRKTRKIELFLESLVMKVMEKQEQMHKQLIQMIEKREKERIMREEAWRRQEMERMRRDEEARAQETSRSRALISLIQNVLGHEIEMPLPSTPLPSTPLPTTIPCMEDNGGKGDQGEGQIQRDISSTCNPNNGRWQEVQMQENGHENQIHKEISLKCDPNNNRRWPEAEVQALIMFRSSLEQKLRVMGSKYSIWDEVSEGMYSMGYKRSAKKCKEKWENINKYFRKSMGSGKKHVENSKRCTYFHELNVLYKNGLAAHPSNPVNYANNQNGEEMNSRTGFKDSFEACDIKVDGQRSDLNTHNLM